MSKKNVAYSYSGILFSSEGNELMCATSVNLKNVILVSERSQTQDIIYVVLFQLCKMSIKGKFTEKESSLVVAYGGS